MSLTANDVMKAARGRMPVGQPSTRFVGATVDSRDVPEGSLFVGLRGETTDGGQYAVDALRAGAAAAVVGESQWMWIEGEAQALGKPVVVVDDPGSALQAAGRAALQAIGARVIAITGSTGKTTTKDILLAMLRAAGVRTEGTRGNQNTEVGVPLSLLNLSDETEVAVVEMGMRGAGQIAELAALASPDVACITNIAPVHLELLGSMENIAAAKAELLEALGDGGVAVVPDDEPLLEPHLAALGAGVEVRRFAAEVELGFEMDLPMAWQRRNASAALECCRAVGHVPPPGGAVPVELSAMRGAQRTLAGGGTLIEDCYNANPLAMEAALRDLAGRGGRRVAVLGDMMELGADEERFHREVGELAREFGIDLLVTVGERARWYAMAAGDIAGAHFDDAEAAAAAIVGLVGDADVVLLKASRSVELERVGAVLS